MPEILPHTQSPLLYLHQQASWKDTHYPHKIHAPLDEENGSYMEQRSTTTVHETTYIFKLKSDKPPHFSVVFSFLECYSEWPDSLKGTVPRSSAICFLFKISYSV